MVGLSPPACLKRVKRLREEGVIVGDVSIINPELTGSKMTLVVSVEMERDRGDIYQIFRHSISKTEEITQCYQISGSFDFMLIVTVKDLQAYEDFVERVLRKDLNIRKFHTSVSMRTVKFTTAVNLDES